MELAFLRRSSVTSSSSSSVHHFTVLFPILGNSKPCQDARPGFSFLDPTNMIVEDMPEQNRTYQATAWSGLSIHAGSQHGLAMRFSGAKMNYIKVLGLEGWKAFGHGIAYFALCFDSRQLLHWVDKLRGKWPNAKYEVFGNCVKIGSRWFQALSRLQLAFLKLSLCL